MSHAELWPPRMALNLSSAGQANPFYAGKTSGESPLLEDAPLQAARLEESTELRQPANLNRPSAVQAIAPGVVQYYFDVQGMSFLYEQGIKSEPSMHRNTLLQPVDCDCQMTE